MNYCVVMPSIRQPNLDYLEPLGDTPVFVVDDSDGNIPKNIAPHIQVFDYADRKKIMGGKEWLIPQKNPSCKNLGLYLAWKEKFDVIILLDDDCDLRVTPNYLDAIPIRKPVKAHLVDTPYGWVNTMELLDEPTMWARGFPYQCRDKRTPAIGPEEQVVSSFNEGLWTGTPDINGADKFVTDNVTAERSCNKLVKLTSIQQLPLSIMNVQIHRDLVPAFYQPPDYAFPGGHIIRRHDDVWSMLVLKKIMDIYGLHVTAGEPIIWHRKEGDKLKEMLSEHITNLIQDTLLARLSQWKTSPTKIWQDAYLLGNHLSALGSTSAYDKIINDYGMRISAWASLFDE